MTTLFSTIGIIGKRDDPRASATLDRLLAILDHHLQQGTLQRVLLSDDTPGGPTGARPTVTRVALAAQCQLVIVIGGDGTLLSAARCLAPSKVPILGINQGRLGFLVEVRPEDIEAAVAEALTGQCPIEERALLSVCVRRGDGSQTPPQLAVNDVVLRNLAAIRMLEFETWLEDADGQWEFISRHRADGLIVSTPTGSTAYALSGGGPILHPQLSALTLVPICPHTLTDRPIAVPAGRRIRIDTYGDNGGSMTCDGQVSVQLDAGDRIEIMPSPHRLRLLHVHGYSYFRLLRDKLLWGRGADYGGNRS